MNDNIKNVISKAYREIDDFTDKLGETFFDTFNEEDNFICDMAKGIIHAFSCCETEREYEIANKMLIGVCGYGIQTLISRIKEEEAK